MNIFDLFVMINEEHLPFYFFKTIVNYFIIYEVLPNFSNTTNYILHILTL